MSIKKERKIGLGLIGSVILVIILFQTVFGCSTYTCPTYAGVKKSNSRVK